MWDVECPERSTVRVQALRVEDEQTAERKRKPIPSDGGLPPSPRLFEELMKAWGGFTLTGEKAAEGPNELTRAPRLMNPKSYVCLSKTT